MLEQLPDAALCAGWFWREKGLNKLADKDDVESVTRRINGGLNGIEDRRVRLAKAKRLFAEQVK
jgi:putative chitinase